MNQCEKQILRFAQDDNKVLALGVPARISVAND